MPPDLQLGGPMRTPLVAGLLAVVLLAALYPWLAQPAQQPLAIFILPMLISCALGSLIDTVIVGAAALTVSLVEGVLITDLSRAGLTVRLTLITLCWMFSLVLVHARNRRQQVVDDSLSRGLLLDVFQDSLVPQPIPPTGVTVRTRYLPGDERLLLGGDFLDAIRLPNGALGYIIGDVCGQGPRAAAFGAAVRSGWKTLATTNPSNPLQWVEGLDQTFFRLGRHDDTFVTLNTGFIDPNQHRRWCFVSAGHPWPVVIQDAVQTIRPEVGPPLGIGAKASWKSTQRTLPPGATIMLYTDGLIENAQPDGRKDNDGERRLIDHLRSTPLDLDELMNRFGPEGFDDDVAVMTISV